MVPLESSFRGTRVKKTPAKEWPLGGPANASKRQTGLLSPELMHVEAVQDEGCSGGRHRLSHFLTTHPPPPSAPAKPVKCIAHFRKASLAVFRSRSIVLTSFDGVQSLRKGCCEKQARVPLSELVLCNSAFSGFRHWASAPVLLKVKKSPKLKKSS
ncbi:uncharacterized protein LOC125117727 isoform X3 [Phacochoerus africanus]|uniref:uncharacterized protein LOC125117727 isoform X3 n=1 Tax=Phacochoerus africanus TaxID=41426 RepID=UPI001FD9E13F|nr:uncharacterized protein LOC125117727 isoform X3 [Phacochoerus africanus]